MKRILCSLIVIFSSITIFASSIFEVEVEAFGNYDIKDKTFYIGSLYSDIKSTDLEFKEYAKILASYLTFKGGNLVKKSSEADVYIMLGYGINDAGTRTYSSPIIGNTTVSSVTSYTDYYGNVHSNVNYNNVGVVGYKQNTTEQYKRYVYIEAYSTTLTDEDELEMLWKTTITSSGYSNSLREVYPIMMYAARFNLGTATEGQAKYKESSDGFTEFMYTNMRGEVYDTFLFHLANSGKVIDSRYIKYFQFKNSSNKVQQREVSIAFALLTPHTTTFYIKSPAAIKLLKDLCLEYDGKSYKADVKETQYLSKYQSEQYQVVTFNVGITDLSKPLNISDNLPEKKKIFMVSWQDIRELEKKIYCVVEDYRLDDSPKWG